MAIPGTNGSNGVVVPLRTVSNRIASLIRPLGAARNVRTA